jgi:hypothetical protein
MRDIIDTSMPPYLARHLLNVAMLTPSILANAGTAKHGSTYLTSSMICLSVNFD